MTLIEQNDIVRKIITIDAPVSIVWQYLTTPDLMKLWMLDADMEMDILTDWKIGSPIKMKGKFHRIKFENTGTILTCQKEKVLIYTHLSSISRLAARAENFCTITFMLIPAEQSTTLELTITNFPTYAIFTHMAFYWKTTLEVLKRQLENNTL
ncbi:SRPBCC domain-containing protein [Rhodocytophaga rosea]|uniref:SRPBCC domain-containing protein n=1 Tax=Rhodocytophaga rosea TaxID=2704465 RepID=A0A6C0GJH1_9BACT|nr:SRPBCC family protein [Rhodocytophaga rosea]QHT68186.1 SRPBCC domain-containing protein [Rhodocytophaga rosea]